MPITAQQLVDMFNEIADTPAELKAKITKSTVREDLRERLQRFRERAGQRLAALQGQIDTLASRYDVAISEAEGGTDPVDVPTTAEEDAAVSLP